jgi:hypothetical protein
MIVLVSIVGTIFYTRHGNGREWVDEGEETPLFTTMTLGNLGKNPDDYSSAEIYTMISLTTITIIIIFVLHIPYKLFQTKVIKKIDEINITPGDFTVMVSNIPKEKSIEDIKEWLLTHQEGEICEINLCFDVSESIYKLRKVSKLKKFVLNYERMPLSVRNKKKNDKEEIQKEIDQLEKDIEEIKNTANSVREFTGKAFVVWNKQSEVESLLVIFERSWIRKLINFFIFKIL